LQTTTHKESILKTPESIHYSGKRKALGNFCTSLRESLLAEADLSIQRKTRVLRVGGRALQNKRTPMKQVEMSLCNGRNTFGNRFQVLMEKIDISSTQLGPVVRIKHPWLNKSRLKISKTITKKYRQEALFLLQHVQNGSKVRYSVRKRRIDEEFSIDTTLDLAAYQDLRNSISQHLLSRNRR
jgi:hypothetical protein